MPIIEIVHIKSGKVADTIETRHAVDSLPYQRFLDGLTMKVDHTKYEIRETPDPPRRRKR